MLIRPFDPADLGRILDIAEAGWRGIYAGYQANLGDELYELLHGSQAAALATKRDEIRKHCERNGQWTWVCEQDGKVVGFVTCWIDTPAGVGMIGNNAVDSDYAGRGIGKQMYRTVLEYLKSQGMTYVGVQTGLDDAHTPARRAYENVGFNIRRESVVYYVKV